MLDRILIEGLSGLARVGVTEAERRRLQRIVLDLEVGKDLRAAGRADQMAATLDYAEVCRVALRALKSRPFRLIEALAEEVASATIKEFRPAYVRLRARKFSVKVARSVGVEIIRGRERRKSEFPRTGPE